MIPRHFHFGAATFRAHQSGSWAPLRRRSWESRDLRQNWSYSVSSAHLRTAPLLKSRKKRGGRWFLPLKTGAAISAPSLGHIPDTSPPRGFCSEVFVHLPSLFPPAAPNWPRLLHVAQDDLELLECWDHKHISPCLMWSWTWDPGLHLCRSSTLSAELHPSSRSPFLLAFNLYFFIIIICACA